MKKLLVTLMAILFVAGLSTLAFANGQGDGIVGSPHDFTDQFRNSGATAMDETWNARNEICRVCHVPHDHNRTRYLNGLLWNHTVSSATYQMYNQAWSSSIDGVQSAQPDGTAKLCLACHDGTVAIDTFDGYTTANVFMTNYSAGFQVPSAAAPNDLRGSHPYSISFPAGQTGDGRNFTDPATATWASGATIASTLDNGKIQCSTCHDVHDQESVAGTHLLRAGQTVAAGGQASGLCFRCHVK